MMILWDFDRTIMDDDSDRWVVVEMGLTQIFNQLRETLPWNSLMDRMMAELHPQGKTIEDIANCLNRVRLHPQIVSAIRSAHGSVLNQLQDSRSENGKKHVIIYIGDGGGDFCPTLKLGEEDHVMPRKNFPLHHLISKSSVPIKPQVHEWMDGEELNKILLRLTDSDSAEKQTVL
ncbi:HAD-like domain-containing protein [Cynara cardunculus var. scolymus]|uniref:HAD-like domain-containing protein n=1 Tax=Cynara cardunculus var. scolymus TaxID=59895 RepID=A0A103Y2B6_CYNCS|nr:HAD-like domain-containing protein [Cynara cardunculus var. scolymus]